MFYGTDDIEKVFLPEEEFLAVGEGVLAELEELCREKGLPLRRSL